MGLLEFLLRASGASGLPIVDGAWDGSAARRALAKWASSDGSGDRDKVVWSKYRRGFFWYDHTAPTNFGAYKLPFATVRNGRLVAVRRGIFAAAAAVRGARGGVEIPRSELPAVRARIAAYYRRMKKNPPWQEQILTEAEGEAALWQSLRYAEGLWLWFLCEHLPQEQGQAVKNRLLEHFDQAGWVRPGGACEKTA